MVTRNTQPPPGPGARLLHKKPTSPCLLPFPPSWGGQTAILISKCKGENCDQVFKSRLRIHHDHEIFGYGDRIGIETRDSPELELGLSSVVVVRVVVCAQGGGQQRRPSDEDSVREAP
eukprot:scaffold87913_cov42-Tisochrysis_lutea.AAC.2